MGRPKKIQPDDSDISDDTEENNMQEIAELPLVMSIAKLETLTPQQKQEFRAKGGTTTEN
jgi:hypothetical protein